MKKTLTAKIAILSLLVTFYFQPVGTQLGCSEQICPLSRYRIEVAENLMNSVQEAQEEACNLGLETSAVEAVVAEAHELLENARILSMQGQNCIAGNILAIRAMSLLKKAQEMLRSPLDALRIEEYAVYSTLIDTGFHLIEYYYSRDELQLIVIRDHTHGSNSVYQDLGNILELVREELPAVDQETLDNFLIKNLDSHPPRESF